MSQTLVNYSFTYLEAWYGCDFRVPVFSKPLGGYLIDSYNYCNNWTSFFLEKLTALSWHNPLTPLYGIL